MKFKTTAEPDLYVVNRMPTEQEFKEISSFIAQNKQQAIKTHTLLRLKGKKVS